MMHGTRDISVFVVYYVYVTSGPSLLIESTDSMINLVHMRAEHKTKQIKKLWIEVKIKFIRS